MYSDLKKATEILLKYKIHVTDPWDIVEGFENIVAEYAGSKYAVAVDSCTNSMFLCLKYLNASGEITVPKKTYLSVPQLIIHAGCKPVFKDIYEDFLAFIKDAEILIHNADFDVSFLNNELKLSNIQTTLDEHVSNIVDTLSLARQLHPGQRNSLDVLTDRYNILGYDRSYHGALLDSKILGEVYLMMTGGQTKLDFNEAIEKKELSLKEDFIKNSVSLTKVVVTTEEERSHQEYLNKIKQNN